MNKKKVPVVSIIMYVLAGLLLVLSVYTTIVAVKYISPSFEQGLTFAGYELEIINFYVSNVGPLYLFAITFFALGWIIQLVSPSEDFDVEIEELEFAAEDFMEEEDEMMEEDEE